MFSILDQINKRYEQLTPVELRIAKYIQKMPERVINMSVKEIASASETSDAAVVRFAKRIGLSGIKELKVELAKELHTVDEKALSRFINLKNDSEAIIFEKVFQNTLRSLHSNEKIINKTSLSLAAKAIHQAKNVYIFGVGESISMGLDFEHKLHQINKNVYFSSDQYLMNTKLNYKTANDVLVVFSQSGQLTEVIKIIKSAKEKDIKVIVFTETECSSVIRLADTAIIFNGEETNVENMLMTSRIAQLMLIDILFFYVCKAEKKHITVKT